MNDQAEQIQQGIFEFWHLLVNYLSQPWFIYQLVLIVSLAGISLFGGRYLAKRIEAGIRGKTGSVLLLRTVDFLLHHQVWILIVLLLSAALLIMQSITSPDHSKLISIALSLAFAWLTISILSGLIQNRAARRLVAVALWIYVAAGIVGITGNAARLLDSVGFTAGDIRISVLLLLKALVILTVALWLAVAAGNFLEQQINRADGLTPSLRVLIGKLIKITLLVVAAVLALSGLGIDVTVFTVFSGAVGVGIGFGLQKVVSNFISGIIILLDRSIKPGDTISLGETFGWIRELRARFVSVVTRDGREYLIPNEDFITREVINWSFSNELVRLDVPFGVSYDSDPHEVSRLAIEATKQVPRVVGDKNPVCWITGFGDSSIDFLLRFWIQDPQNGLTNIRGTVYLALWDSFKANDIKIPFPHRELILKNSPGPGALLQPSGD